MATAMSEHELNEARGYMHKLLSAMSKAGGSDLFITAEVPPSMKVNGSLLPMTSQPLPGAVTKRLIASIMNRHQQAEFEKDFESNFVFPVEGLARFRVNAYLQQQQPAMVLRAIPTVIPTVEQLGLPDSLKKIVEQKRGLVLVVGATGSGKSTALAAMIDHRNRTTSGHIVTIEDPVEFVHSSKKSVISHREVGVDTHSWHNALKNALRQAPDVILIGEIRDMATMEHALAFAETGHLCLGTLHASSASQTMDRIVNFFPEERRQQVLLDLSSHLRSVVSQRLIPTADGKGRKAAVEILINTPTIAERILNREFNGVREIMERSRELGMRTFDWALFELYNDGHISYMDALHNADSENELRLAIKLRSPRGQPREASSLDLSMLEEDEEKKLTPDELAAQREEERRRQEETRRLREREQLATEIDRNRHLQERRRKKEDEELLRIKLQKSLSPELVEKAESIRDAA
jgi:twitching motility protein PilU